MKPITFESIRNFWRNKKKGKDKDGVGIMDASFKRSDSFKRISIRKSYLDRGRKRAALRARAINSNCNLNNGDNNSNINENVLIHSDSTNNAISKNLKTIIHTSSSTSNAYNICAIEPIIYEESNGKLSTKIDRSCENLTVIHNTSSSSTKSTNNSNLIKQIEVKNGIFIGLNGSIETQSQSKYSSSTKTTEISDNNDFGNSSWNKSLNHSWNSYEKLDKKFSNSDLKPNLNKNSSDKETEIQIISVDFQNNSSNSSESIYNDIVSNNEDDCSDNGQINNCKHNNISNINIVSFGTFTNESNKTDDNRSTISLTNYSEPSQYEKSNAVRLEYNSITSSNSNLNDKNLITFKTFTPAKNFLETNFDCIVDPIHQSCASINSINSKTSLNISKTNLVYHTKPLSKSQSKSIQSINSSHSIGSSNQERQQQSTNEKEKVVIHIAAQDKNDNEITDSDDTYAQVVDAFSSSSSRNFKNNSLHSPTTPTEKCKESEKVLQPAIPTKQPPVKPARKQLPVQKIPSRNSSFSDIHFSTANEITPVSKELNLIEPVSPTEKHYESFLFEQEQPDLDLYDDSNIMSPNNSIPYQLRVKTNPFTHQKELYSVNLGRVWKQLNLGQDEDLSIDISSSNQKKKNESFKSMSSRDSGFSLTLTKPKGIFRRRSKNCNQNLKGTINGGRDIRRGQIIQRNSSKRRKLKRYDINGRPIYTNNDHFLREFEEFCAVRRQRLKAYTKQSLDEIDPYCNNDTFNREISDLEAFFEEHLKRLKTYYLERKKINEETLNQFYNDFITSNEIHKKFNASSHKVESTQSNKNITGGEDTQNDYTFPYPDKRNRIKTSLNNLISNSNNNKNKKQKCLFQEVRTFANDDLKYASLIFEDQVNNNSRKKSNHKHYYENDSFHCPRPRLLQKSKHEKIPYADIDFERKCISNFPITTTKDLFDYPKHWKMTETRHHKKLQRNRRNRSGRTRQRYRKNQQFSNWPLDSYKSAKEISLAHCFPSINDPPNRSVCDKKKLNRNNSICSPIPINSDGTCCNCCKLVKNGISMSDSNDSNSNRCSLASDTDNDNDDEFSENEFLSNCDVCWDCDNQLGECICDPPKQKKQNPKKISKRNNNKSGRIASEYCKCPRVYKISTESDDNTDDNIKDIRYNKVYLNIDKNKEYINGDGSGIIASKKKIRRKKSKRKIGKNHSTLRRKYTNSTICDITQKGYEKKRTRLLQPYVNKNSQGGGGGNNGSKDNSNMPPYYNLKDHQGVGGGGGGNGGNTNNQPPPPPPIQSEGYSYVYETELPSLPSSQHRHSHHKSSSSHHGSGSGGGGGGHGQNRARRTQRRITHNEKRYHSEVRQEAVQQALAALKNRPKPSLPMPSKRSSVLNRSPDRDRDDTDSTTDDESIPEERISTPDREYNYPRDHISNSREQIKPPIRDSSVGGGGGGGGNIGGQHHKNFSDRRPPQNLPPPPHSDTSSAGSPPAVHRKNNYEFTDISEFQRPYVAPDITQFNNTRRGADRVTRYVNISGQEPGDTGTAGRWKVSAKIQQLLNTLKRPKRRPLPEFYEDNDIELEIAANPKDPNAPKPEGNTMSRVQGEQLTVAAGLPRNLETALQRFGTNSFKSPVATVLDPNGKLTTMLTYGKLLSRAQKIAYALTTKVFSKGPEQITLKPGDRVALVYPNSDPLNFLTAWYGCMFRGLVPLPIELPLSSSDTPPQQIGFLLSSCGISVALTSEACLKGLPKSSTGEIAKLKGWPRLHWFVTEHLPKPPKDFNVGNVRIEESSLAYIEYATDKEGSVMGVTVTRQAMMNHCRALTMACHYTEGETIVCVLDFKREVGLWHAILTSVLNGMHVVFIPYALMKLRPSSWMQLITKYRASCCLVKSRDLHWGLLATKDHKDISLSSLRMLLVADGANPWSLSSCDQFLSVFQTKGLRADAICPCASSCEVFTVSLRRPGRASGGFVQSATGRGVLSMAALSHGVVRVDSEDSLTSLTLQDCGQVMPAAQMVVVRSDGPPVLCKTDQVGEICVTSGATGTSYFGLEGLTNSTFKIQPLLEDPDTKDPANTGKTLGDEYYVRSGLLGFLGPGGLVFVCGSRDGLMTVTGRKHNADDIIATVLAVEPMRFIYRGRIAVFSIKVLRDERVCVIAEQRPDCSEEESFQWMSRVLQAVDSIHQVGIYCLALVPPNHLPKTPLGGIHLCEARRRFLEGSLHPANVLMCPHTCVTNLPKPREIHQGVQPPTTVSSSSSGCGITDTSVGPASVMVGNLVQGNRLAVAQGRDIGLSEDSERKHQLITGVLRWRANTSPDHVLYTLLNSKGTVAKTLTCSELHKRAEKIAALLQERGKVEPGDHVALIFPPGLDLICAFYGCLYLGAVPITIRPPHPQNLITTLPTVRMIVDVSKSGIVLSIQSIIKLLKSREAAASIDPKSWPPILDIDDNPKRKLAAIANATLDSTAYLDFSVSTCGRLSGVIITHRSLSSLCASLKLACELYPSRHVALCLDPYCGLGFAMWTLISVYSGHHSILIAPYEVEANPSLWLATLSQYRVRDTFCSYGVIELCTKALSNSIQALKQRNIDLRCVRTCVVVAEERPRVQLTQQFCKLFQALGLNTRCVSTSFGCRVNPAICVQGASSAESAQVYVDLRALRNNRVALVERGAPNSLCLIESGKLLPGVKVIIANPETKGHCGDSHLGEIWVQSPHNANGYFTIYGDETDYNDHFNAKLVTGSTTEVYARTGYLGFLRRTECSQAGSILDETTPSIASRDSDNESIHSMNQLQHNMSSMSIGGSGGTGIGGSGRIINDNAILSTGVIIGQNSDQELHDAVYVVGALDEVISLRGMNYHPIDIENSVLRCHKKIAECAVFTWTNLLVVVVELDGNESEALDLVPLVTNTVLEEHQLIVGVVVVVDPGVVPINSRGEKQRMHLRDGFLADQLDPIYVAYNM
ncbi:disco-interacting protein 2 isoform X6 [Condylostylus longicornis]|uniref:disco-interacting protein 2 isoform X6 n=1 Tax=Condylostylus longicornis TaxID=2530218 RepID=UPI00244E12DC|nr:disco-interacting protein 2 isoform X6 [Condylostylus longicornis]